MCPPLFLVVSHHSFYCSPILMSFYGSSQRNFLIFLPAFKISLSIFGFHYFGYDVLRCALVFVIFLRVHWALWICGLMSFINFRKYLAIISSYVSLLYCFSFLLLELQMCIY